MLPSKGFSLDPPIIKNVKEGYYTIKELTVLLGLLVILAACGCVEKGTSIQNLKDPDSSVRLQAAKDLEKNMDVKTASIDTNAIDPLIEVLKTDKNSSVREQAAKDLALREKILRP